MSDSSESKKAWEQRAGEPDEAYARFLIYRNLGPGRSIPAAYKSTSVAKRKKTQGSGQWNKDSAEFNWPERAARWDVYTLSQVVPETAAYIFQSIKEFARLTLDALKSGNYEPRNFVEVRDSLVVLAGFISPDIIADAVDNAADAGHSASGAPDGGE